MDCHSVKYYNEYSGLISFRIDWFDLLAVLEILKSLFQHCSSKVKVGWEDMLPMKSPQSIETDQRPDKEIRQCFTGAFAEAEGRENKQQPPLLACSLRGEGGSGSLHGVRVEVCPGVGPEGWLRCFAQSLW